MYWSVHTDIVTAVDAQELEPDRVDDIERQLGQVMVEPVPFLFPGDLSDLSHASLATITT